METKRQELKARIEGLRERVSYALASGRRGEYLLDKIAAAERELAALDAAKCSDCLYYDAPGRCSCFADAISETDNCLTSKEWAYNFTPRKPKQEAQ